MKANSNFSKLKLVVLFCIALLATYTVKAGHYEIISKADVHSLSSGSVVILNDKLYEDDVLRVANGDALSNNRVWMVRLKNLKTLRKDISTALPYTLTVNYSLQLLNGDDANSCASDKGFSSEQLTIVSSSGIATSDIPLAINKYSTPCLTGSAKLTVNSVVCSSAMPADAVLELVLVNDRYTSIDNEATTLDVSNNGDKLSAVWDYVPGAERYDFEYVFVDALTTGSVASAADAFQYIEPTRIVTNENFANVDLAYPAGTLYFRVRPIGRFIVGADCSHEYIGAWTTGPSFAVTNTTKFESDKSWQVVRTFAEEGKSKTVLSYFDPTGRSRQSVTNISTNDLLAVVETKYDYEGRPVLKTLPAIYKYNNDLKYKGSLHLTTGIGGIPVTTYTKENFENIEVDEDIPAMAGGSADYYSYKVLQSSTNITGENLAYIPDAENYPFTLTHMTPDNRNKPIAQSGVGRLHKLKNGHDTRYFYSSPSSTELHRLFGSNVGEADHYKEVMTQDPNGQLSVTYMNQEDKPIATFLTGNAPTNLVDLNEVAQGPLTENLSGKNKPNYTDHSVNMVYTVPNALPNTDFLFSYDLSKNEDMAGCPTCSYKLTVQVTGTNNEPISVSVTSSLPFGSDAGSDLSKGIVVNSFGMSDVCANTSTKLAFTFNAVDIGNYTISKTLQLLPFEITPALLSQIQTSYGVPSLANLLAEAEGTADTSVCNPANQPSTGPLVSNAINSVTKAECQSLLTQMRSEVMPASEAPASGTDFCGVVDGHYYHGPNTNTFWTNVSDHYSSLKNHLAGIPSSVLDGPQLVAYVIDVNNWQDSWADTLVRYHPEYCRYLACEALRTSHEYDDNMAVVQKYSAGNALGYTDCTNDPLKNADVSSFCNANMTTVANDFCNALAHYNQFLSSSTTGLGSILASSGASNAAYTSTDLANFTNFLDAPGTSFTLADCMDPTKNVFFDGTTYIIANNPNSTTNINPLYQNVDVNDPLAVDQQRWKLFRGAYSAIKQKIIDDEIYHACGCDYLHDAYADDASTQCPYIVVKDPNLQGNNNAYCEEVKKETVKYWLSQIEQRVESVCSTFVVPPANPTATIDIDNQAVLDLITAKLNAFWGTDDQFCNEPIIMVNNAQVAASPLADIPTLTASLKDASGQACSTALLTPSDHCEDRVAAWMDKVESIMTNRSSGCADAFHNGYLCDYTIPGITCPNSVKIKDYINDRFVGYCANNSNILNENIMLTHDAIQTDPDLQKIEVLMQIMGCSNLHEVVAQEPLNQNNCPQPDPCAEAMFSFMNLNVFNHSSTYFPTTGSINASTLPVMDNCDADVPGGKFFPDNQLSGGAFFSFTDADPNLTSTSSITDYMSQYNFVFLDQCGKPISVNDIAQINYTEVLVDQAGPGADLSAFSSIQGIQGCVLFSRLVCSVILKSNTHEFCATSSPHATDPPYAGLAYLYRYMPGCTCTTTNTPNPYNGSVVIPQYVIDAFNPVAPITSDFFTGTMSQFASFLTQKYVPVEYHFQGAVNSPQWNLSYSSPLSTISGFDNSPQNYLCSPPSTDVCGKILLPLAAHQSYNTSYTYYPYNSPTFTYYEFFHTAAVDIRSGTTQLALDNVMTWDASTGQFQANSSYQNACISVKVVDFNLDLSPLDYSIKTLKIIIGDCIPDDQVRTCTGPAGKNPDMSQPCNTLTGNSAYTDCVNDIFATADYEATQAYENLMDAAVNEYTVNYYNTCMQNAPKEDIYLTHNVRNYHYTLYYYDQAHNLIQTVPPNGVHPLPMTNPYFDATGNYLGGEPSHTMPSTYQYNTLNQVTSQSTPDGGKTDFYYNSASQLRLSQNDKQRSYSPQRFSFTNYDKLARITQVGEVYPTTTGSPAILTDRITLDALDYIDLTATDRAFDDVTLTYYDATPIDVSTPSTWVSLADPAVNWANSDYRKRVTSTYFCADWGSSLVTNILHGNGTFYKYDELGNVKSLVQRIYDKYLSSVFEKSIDYDYDVISGKVTSVAYQAGQSDQMTHRYEYDADNRITNVYTSRDGVIWDQDAQYFYYPHGPLARVELGQDHVQGLDYYYTIHGWLKGVNIPFVNEAPISGGWNAFATTSDPGADGFTGASSLGQSALNRYFAKDKMAYALHYYMSAYSPTGMGTYKDYKPVIASVAGYIADARQTNTIGYLNYPGAAYVDPNTNTVGLYNGNIYAMVTDVPQSTFPQAPSAPSFVPVHSDPLLNVYQYDQLNRLVNHSSHYYSSAIVGGDDPRETWAYTSYGSSYSYDPNGNITNLKRYAPKSIVGVPSNPTLPGYTYNITQQFDNIDYKYNNTCEHNQDLMPNNQLTFIQDMASATNSVGSDIKTSTGVTTTTCPSCTTCTDLISNKIYEYDLVGNLIQDHSEGIGRIDWNAYQKMTKLEKSVGSVSTGLAFGYDATGQRVMKDVFNTNATGSDESYSYYIRDASGNIMATITKKDMIVTGSHYIGVSEIEYPIYGSSRIGTRISNPTAESDPSRGDAVFGQMARITGRKQYELNDHLGNVLATISDHRIGVGSGTTADYYTADVQSAQDYYPFGMLMPGRHWGADYKFGFNKGSEKDDEISGSGNHFSTLYREGDARVATWWGRDPKYKAYESPYVSMGDNPIWFNDPKGDDFATDNNEQSHNDIKSIAGKYKDIVNIDEKNVVTIDFNRVKSQFIGKDGKLDVEAFTKYQEKASKHPGVKLLMDLELDTKDYFYAASYVATVDFKYGNGEWSSGGTVDNTKLKGTTVSKYGWFTNTSSNYIRGDEKDDDYPKNDKGEPLYTRPANGIDGYVIIAPGTVRADQNGSLTEVPRASYVFHELQENYYKTHDFLLYKAAHEKSKETEGFKLGNLTPGDFKEFEYGK